MVEYIEREALLDSKDWRSLQNYDKARAKAIILGQPVADVVEVRHGEWVRVDCEDRFCYWYECSVCGQEPPQNNYGHDYHSAYCPNCGAKMDGKDDTDD